VIRPGDLNGDGRISAGDVALAAGYYGKQAADEGWDETYRYADMNGDGMVDQADFSAIASLILA
jgi:Ca2+-binding EF-hand superfamily protein